MVFGSIVPDSGPRQGQSVQFLKTALPCLPVILVGAWALSCLYSIFFHPLRSIPGPFLAKFTEAWRTYKYARGKWHEDVLALHRKYGPVVRVSPNEVSIVDKEGIRKVFGHGTGTKKSVLMLLGFSLPQTSPANITKLDCVVQYLEGSWSGCLIFPLH